MEPHNRIVMNELIERDKETRQIALSVRDSLNAKRIAAHDPQAGPPPEPLNHKDDMVADEVFQLLHDNPDDHPACIEKYDAMAKQYNKHA